MSTNADFDDYEDGGVARRWMHVAVPSFVLLLIAGMIWYLMHSTTGTRREAPPLQTILTTLPPPPPPPPPKPEKVEPEKKVEETPKPNEVKTPDAPKPMTINGPAQAGNDAFNIGAGDGSGSVGSSSGLGDESYSRYMGSSIQQMIQQDDSVNRLVFSTEVAVWIDANGHLTQAKIVRSSGDDKTDEAVLAALKTMPSLEQPPSTLQFPQRIAIRGRRV
ncbi:MAG TPA: energy transducer TonB [Rhizomicrobium sp.]|jgi:TonB family protein